MGKVDGRRNNGGHSTKGRAGRKSKAEEFGMAQLIKEAVSDDDWIVIFSKACEQAKTGDKAAREWLTDRHFGKVVERRVNKELDKGDTMKDLNEEELRGIIEGGG